ncbi:uncharacterized protein LOC126379942 [Pectinophora gossypiella]|uniref:uncharacterized protein LOC126379942 n=1 Tax=Pectinophora gossypiella TaxID=13191 RepID=UPI00214DF4A2|nr:uncharacterized protein LOC126379942 [Pectinophora gossypiella]
MPTCSTCNQAFNDGVTCGECSKNFGFCCAPITEGNYRKLGPDRRSQWRCGQCKISAVSNYGVSTPAPRPARASGSDNAVKSNPTASSDSDAVKDSLSAILLEIRDIKRQLVDLPSLVQEVKNIKVQIGELQSSCEFSHEGLIEQDKKITDLEIKVSEIQALKTALDMTSEELAVIKSDLADRDQRSRLNNIEVKGIPVKNSENLFGILEAICVTIGYDIPKTQINYIARVPVQNSNDKSIIINLNNRYIKEDFVAAARRHKSLSTSAIAGVGGNHPVYINDHLTPVNKRLLTKAKTICKDKGYEYVWVKHCKIHARKNDTSKIIVIKEC